MKRLALIVAFFALAGAAYAAVPTATVTTTDTTATLAGLKCNQQYRVRIWQQNVGGGYPSQYQQLTPKTKPCPVADPPTASFTWQPLNPAGPPVLVTFTSTGTCPASPCTYEWHHGPPGSELFDTGQTGEFTFQSTGTKTVVLHVTDSLGRTADVTNSFTVSAAPPPPDADGDGVPDADDQCPDEPGPASNGGCPEPPPPADSDGDGVPDSTDLCPGTLPGVVVDADGCPVTEPPGGLPDATNTGVPPGTVLTPSGGLNITTAGAVIDARDISGQVVVNAPNVTIQNSRIRTTAFFAVDVNSTGLVIKDSEIDGLGSRNTAIGSSGFTLLRDNVHGSENGCDIGGSGNVTVQDTYIHDLTTTGDAHTDGCQIGQGAENLNFIHNNISPQSTGTPASTSAIIMWTREDPQNAHVLFQDNRLDGSHASYALYCPRNPATDIRIIGNRFVKGVFGEYTDSCVVGNTVTEWSSNVDDATGQEINADGSIKND